MEGRKCLRQRASRQPFHPPGPIHCIFPAIHDWNSPRYSPPFGRCLLGQMLPREGILPWDGSPGITTLPPLRPHATHPPRWLRTPHFASLSLAVRSRRPGSTPLPAAARDLVGRLFGRDRIRVGRYLGGREKNRGGSIQAAGRARLLARRNEERSASARLACPTLQSCQSAYRRLL